MPDRFRREERGGDQRLIRSSRNDNVFDFLPVSPFAPNCGRHAIQLRGCLMNRPSPYGPLAWLWRCCNDLVMRFNLRLRGRSLRSDIRGAGGRSHGLPSLPRPQTDRQKDQRKPNPHRERPHRQQPEAAYPVRQAPSPTRALSPQPLAQSGLIAWPITFLGHGGFGHLIKHAQRIRHGPVLRQAIGTTFKLQERAPPGFRPQFVKDQINQHLPCLHTVMHNHSLASARFSAAHAPRRIRPPPRQISPPGVHAAD